MLAGFMLACAHITTIAADNIQEKIKNTDQKILKEQKKIQKEQAKQKKATRALSKTKKEIDSLDRNLSQLSKKEKALLTDLKMLRDEEKKLQAGITDEKVRLSQLIKRTYILGYSPETRPINSTLTNSKVSAFYLKKIALKRSQLIKNFNLKIKSIDKLQKKKRHVRKELKKIKKDTSKQKSVAELKKEKKSSEIHGSKTRIKRSEKKIKAEKKQLTKLFSALEKRKKERLKNNNLPDRSVSGKPFQTLKGKLRLPALGTVTAKFGQKRTASELPWEGIFISSRQGSSVKLISGGSVVYSDWLRGFGNLIIVDHGKGYYSLYGNNESIWVREGDQLEAGDQLGTVGNSGGHNGSGVYFEIRHNSKPLDPMEWVNITK